MYLAIPLYSLSIFIHIGVGAFFLYKLLHKFFKVGESAAIIGSLLWISGGFNVEFLAAGDIVMEAAYVPICAYFILSFQAHPSLKNFLRYFISLALGLLLGYPIVSLLVFGISSLLFLIFEESLSEKAILYFLRTQVIGLLFVTLPIIAPLYFPAFLNFSYTVRSSLPLESLFYNSASPLNLMESLLPKNKIFGTSGLDVYIYFSLIGLAILVQSGLQAFKERRNIIILTLGAIGVFLALGKITYLPFIMYFLMPGVNLFRRLSLFSLIADFSFCILVAQSFKYSLQSTTVSTPAKTFFKIIFGLLVLLQILEILGVTNTITTTFKDIDFEALYSTLLYTLILSGLSILVILQAKLMPRIAYGLLILFILIEFGTTVAARSGINSKVNPVSFFKENSLIMKLQELTGQAERVDIVATPHSYATDYLDLEQTSGYLSLGSMYASELNDALKYEKTLKTQNLKNLLGIKYTADYLTTEKVGAEDTLVEVGQDNLESKEYYKNSGNKWELEAPGTKFLIKKNNSALPRLFLAKEVIPAPQDSKLLGNVIATDPKSVYANTDAMQNLDVSSGISIEEYDRNYIRAHINNTDTAYLANTTAYYPGWKVKVNGTVRNPIQTNWFMMGTLLDPGDNTVEFYYVPRGLFMGFGYSIVALIAWFVLMRARLKNKMLR